MPVAWRCLGSSEYDAVITSHHAFAHVNRLSRGVHLAYVHSPARYVWSPNLDARGAARYLAIPRLALKAVDGNAARRVTAYAANSREVAGRIRRFWNRDAVVIHPPVRTDFFRPSASFVPSRQYVLGVGRWIGYKNLHLVIEAASAAGLPVKIAGRGPERERLEASAKAARVPVEIVAEPTDERLRELYQNALALVFPTAEDFGLVPVEAQAAGTPVVALGRGGALDTVVDGVTGVLTSSTDVAELADAIGAAAALRSADCVLNAERFSRDAFRRRILDWASTWGVAP
ncbi:MAG TPA: glycosyltransferase [Solirubrobacteraceae bacterium]|jgi:glycosyltransferase involved in cell wall biosynthesis